MAPDLLALLIAHPRIVELAEFVLGEFADGILIHQAVAGESYPGAPAQPFHHDSGALWRILGIRFPQSVTAMLEGFTAELGATEVLIGSHRWPEASCYDSKKEGGWGRYLNPVRPRSPRRSKPSRCPRVLLSSGRATSFTGGANTSQAGIRRAMMTGYSLGWLARFMP